MIFKINHLIYFIVIISYICFITINTKASDNYDFQNVEYKDLVLKSTKEKKDLKIETCSFVNSLKLNCNSKISIKNEEINKIIMLLRSNICVISKINNKDKDFTKLYEQYSPESLPIIKETLSNEKIKKLYIEQIKKVKEVKIEKILKDNNEYLIIANYEHDNSEKNTKNSKPSPYYIKKIDSKFYLVAGNIKNEKLASYFSKYLEEKFGN